jgi:glycosyltransferase involved in cell wall biosynthesis
VPIVKDRGGGVKKTVLIVGQLDGKGPTGVETHVRQLLQAARDHGFDSRYISPYPSSRIWTKFPRFLVRVLRLFDRERAELMSRWTAAKVIESKLMAALSTCPAPAAVTLYAQDTLSAMVALRVKNVHQCRVVVVIHFNVSEAQELCMKGEAIPAGLLWRSLDTMEERTLPRVDEIIFVSEFMRRMIRERLPDIAGVAQAVIPNFATPPSPGDRPEIVGDMIAIGTLEARKNQLFLLRVLARAKSLGHAYTLTIVGNGPDEAALKASCRHLGIEDQVHFVGFRPQAAYLISGHRVLVHAARMENLPITLIEALSRGRPILAPAVGGIGEIFSDKVEGFFWPLDDIDSAAVILISLLSNPVVYERLARAARRRYDNAFSSDKLAPAWLTAILDQGVGRPTHMA